LIQGSSIATQGQIVQFIQTGMVTDIDVTSMAPADLLWEVNLTLQANGLFTDPPTSLAGHPNVTLQRVEIYGMTYNGAKIALFWGTPGFGPPSIYIVRNSTTLSTFQTDLMPGTRQPLRMADTSVAGTDETGAAVSYPITGDNVLFNFLRPLELIQVYSLNYGAPKYSNNLVGRVNDSDWPTAAPSFPTFGGYDPTRNTKAKGYWLLNEWTTDIHRYAGYYTLNASAISKVNEDWSDTAVAVDQSTGKRIALVDPVGTVAAMMTPPYSYSIIYNANGMMRVGPYDVTGFAALFGF
jgi:hypothetical protein